MTTIVLAIQQDHTVQEIIEQMPNLAEAQIGFYRFKGEGIIPSLTERRLIRNEGIKQRVDVIFGDDSNPHFCPPASNKFDFLLTALICADRQLSGDSAPIIKMRKRSLS